MDRIDDNGMGLTTEQMDKVLQFQDLTGIEDMTTCREVLQRHQWDLEVAIQEHLNIGEGRPSVFASEARPPTVVRDHIAQHVYTDSGEPSENPSGFRGLYSYVVNLISICYNTMSSIVKLLLRLVWGDDRRIVTDPLGDVMSFISAYAAKYSPHPVFYQGTYAQALSDAKQELRFLLVYLHSDDATETPNFCRMSLSNSAVITYINQNMLMWGCSVEVPEGYRVCQSMGAGRRFPLMCIVALRENRMTIVGRIEGFCPPDILLFRLREIVDANEIYLAQARADRVERSLTAQLRSQQDEAYEESLRADQEKERRKRELKEAQIQQEKQMIEEIEREERRKQEIVIAKQEMAQSLPAEPASSDPDGMAVLIKLPCGARLERRFRSNDSLQDLYNYVYSHPQSPEEFEITTNFPKRVLELTSLTRTLGEIGLKNRDVLFVNDCNA